MLLSQLRIYLVHETRFRFLQHAMDININTLPQVLYSCLALYNYFELYKEKISKQSLALTLNLEKRVQPATSNLSFNRVFNEKKATDVHNTLTLSFEYTYTGDMFQDFSQ